jgi:hypothetical protein
VLAADLGAEVIKVEPRAGNVIRNRLVLNPNPPDAVDRGARAYNEVIARHPRLESVIFADHSNQGCDLNRPIMVTS